MIPNEPKIGFAASKLFLQSLDTDEYKKLVFQNNLENK